MMVLLAAQKTLVSEHIERIPSKTPGRYGLNTPRGTDSGDPTPTNRQTQIANLQIVTPN